MKHGNIALFIPHNGCPNQCSFCNQGSITGKQYQPTPEDVDNAVREALSYGGYGYEIAFFGGSFTAIDREYMVSLLKAAHKYVMSGEVQGIRVSTRPDAIDNEALAVLKKYGVTSIELGAQSMCDNVLAANRRGHSAQDVRDASRLIKAYGFSLGLQMMTGLYKSDDDKDIYTAKEIAALRPATVRIYPTVTLKGTPLAELFESGEYIPPELESSVELCSYLLKLFQDEGIDVIRLGLHHSEDLERGMVYDNYHPAFRELCESRLMLDKFKELVSKPEFLGESELTVCVNPRCVSKLVGQKKANLKIMEQMGYRVRVKQDESVQLYSIKIEKM